MGRESLTITLKEFSQTLDLDKLVGKPVSQDKALARAIMQEVIDYTKTRVIKENAGYNGKALKSPYSKTYQSTLDFIASGKSASDVNMKLSGDMLGSIDILEEKGSKFTYGLSDPEVIPRAYGHQTGFEGHPNSAMSKYKREWFGISEREFKSKILPKFKDELKDVKANEAKAQDRLIKVAKSLKAFVEEVDNG
jgi:hypothetical protein